MTSIGGSGVAQDAALARCVAPHTTEEFLERYWEQGPLLVSRAGSENFDDLLSEDDVERIVCSGGLRFPAFRLVKAGGTPATSGYTVDVPWRPSAFTGTADLDRVVAEFEAGATIVLQALHLNWPRIGEFCRDLEGSLAHAAQVNAYYTPRDSQGLPVHHDTHDVFVLQVAGEKRWNVYEPVLELPLRTQHYSPSLGSPGPTVLDATLRPGDTLYLPRGWLHEAVTSKTNSLHLTVGVNVVTQLDALRSALDECAEDVEFRRSISSDGEMDDDLLERLRARLQPEEVVRRNRRRLVAGRRPIRPDQLEQLRSLRELSLATPVERRPTVIADLELGEDGASRLVFEGKTILLPPQARLDVTYAFTAPGTFSANELPGDLDEAGRLVLVRRLIREGFLRIAAENGVDSAVPAPST